MKPNVAARVRGLIERLAPEPVCDDCIGERLDVGVARRVSQTTRELAGLDGFERQKGECSLCGVLKEATRKKGRLNSRRL